MLRKCIGELLLLQEREINVSDLIISLMKLLQQLAKLEENASFVMGQEIHLYYNRLH